jgi:hypothetical protein
LKLPTRSVIGLDADLSQPIADNSDDTGRGTCQADPEHEKPRSCLEETHHPLRRKQGPPEPLRRS